MMGCPDKRDDLFRRYVSCVNMGGTRQQRADAWDRYLKAELADVRRTVKAERRAEKCERTV